MAALVVRDPRGYVLAASRGAHGRPPPGEVLDPDALRAFPEEGGRLPLVAGARQVGWLDLWGNGLRASPRSRRALSGVARLIALLMLD